MDPAGPDAARQRLADLLVAARRERRQVRDLPPELIPAMAAEGYAIADLVAHGLGWAPLGWKIAATTPVMQQRLRTTEPIYGRTYRRFETPSPAVLPHAELLDPLVECEFFFRLRRALPPRETDYGPEEVADAVASVNAGIEVAECRFPLDQLPPIPAILADGAASGRYVVGAEIENWRTRDLAAMAVTLEVDGTVRRAGRGSEVMGHPLNPLVWLANVRSRWGDGLAEGALVSTGTATGMLLAKAGDRVTARFGGTVAVEIAFPGAPASGA
ncbi:MAG: fumarylacetoacetate hydrolase family protein [Hyphomicrobiaceae bacterium]|nr:fumarylacetoacetate hydrolase family protein [Hyphomicrobiaceae bacterium]